MTVLAEIAATLKTTEANAVKRAVLMRISPTCGRCGGSGRYSFNQMDGDRCYGCNGAGHVPPKKPKQFEELLVAAKEAVSNGELDVYLKGIEARNFVKGARDRMMKSWTDTKVAATNSAISHMVPENELPGLKELRAANKIMCDAYTEVSDLSYKLDNRSPDYGKQCIALQEVILKNVKIIKDADYEPPANLIEAAEIETAKRAAYRLKTFGY